MHAAFFEDLILAEESGKKARKGIFSNKDAPVTRYNDLTVPGSAMKAKQHLPFLQRAGTVSGVCEYVLSGSRLKIYIPKESVAIAFSPSGVKCPGREEEFSQEAMAFTRARVLQRTVDIQVETVDKIGTFLGVLNFPSGNGKIDLGAALLEAGLARLHNLMSVSQLPNSKDLMEAEARAKENKLRIWSKEEAVKEEKIDKEERFKRESVTVAITEMRNANQFFVQFSDGARAEWIAQQMIDLSLDNEPAPQVSKSITILP